MNCPRIICPPDPALLRRFEGRELAVRVHDPASVQAASDAVKCSKNRLICVILDSEAPASDVEPGEGWKDIPIALMAPSVGRFARLAGRLPVVRGLDLRVFLPYSARNLAGIRMLSSVGVPSCLVMEGTELDWDALADLATYALLENAPHAPIEPFAEIARRFTPDARTAWGSSFFEEPGRFIHLDAGGRAALSRRELLEGEFIGDIDMVESPAGREALKERAQAWRRNFSERRPCADCEGFRVCLGRFAREDGRPRGCAGFFSELLDILEQHRVRGSPGTGRGIWRP